MFERAGFTVRLPDRQLCCGRPLYDHGFLDRAKRCLTRIVSSLESEIAQGIPVVVLEPSCCSVFRDELVDLLPDVPDAIKLSTLTFTLAEFMERYAPGFQFPQLNRNAIVQGHCHHKAVMRMNSDKRLFDKLKLNYRVLGFGCCGMAGAFGYEVEKFAISQQCGERALFPDIRTTEPSTLIMADGFSCREQIEQATSCRTYHLAEVIYGGTDKLIGEGIAAIERS